MQALTTIRTWHLDMLHRDVKLIGHLLKNAATNDLKTYRDGGDGWTVLEVICHLRDWEQLFLERAKLIISEDMPNLPNPDPDEAATAGRYLEQNLDSAYENWARNRANFVLYVEGLSDADWERAGMHPRRGRFTVTDQLFLSTWHDSLHMEQIVKILNQK